METYLNTTGLYDKEFYIMKKERITL